MGQKRKRSGENALEGEIEASLLEDGITFESFGLDQRLLQAIIRQQYVRPTLVQAKAIPLAMEGKDILARAKTGSGKTAAYIIPILEHILKLKENKPAEKAVRALIFVPTRELAEQCVKLVVKLTAFCGKLIRCVNLAQNTSDQVHRSLLADTPDIVVGTPSRILSHINASTLSTKLVTQLVIDEADLVMSYGYQADLTAVQSHLPRTLQIFLMSATLTADVNELKGLFCRNPAVLTLHEDEENGPDSGKISQYMVTCSEFDKFLLAYVIFKLNLIKGKTIIFVNDIDRCYRLKLFLEQFGIRACVLNSDLPVNSRLHVVDQFNKNIYSLIIATDEADQVAPAEETEESTEKSSREASKPGKRRRRGDREYGVSRGIDFQDVSCVLNFDLPTSSKAYTHRIGRTGRAGQSGMALSFVVPRDQWNTHKVATLLSAKRDEKVLARIQRDLKKRSSTEELKPYVFDMKQVDAFRYRMDDAFRAVTKTAIREARTKELKQEIMASDKLKKHFEANPDELDDLRHDRESHIVRVQHHLKHVPDYLLPETGRRSIVQNLGFIGARKPQQNRIRKARAIHKARAKPKRADPLRSFRARKTT
ncbi:P-loop containing nucleoside triphosphate hydrolase protein [Limtongia smithiae]|uniref:P-loop containing nucleoside triphosphate hydrolase protein n=1 Tax=Limtongia smithiae TaxID=1125753 RepID=UPI0034CF5500